MRFSLKWDWSYFRRRWLVAGGIAVLLATLIAVTHFLLDVLANAERPWFALSTRSGRAGTERIDYIEQCHQAAHERTDEFFERDGWRIERWCPHRQADLSRFGEITDGVLTCSLHHWRFDLETGRCLTSDDRHLRCARMTPP